MSIFNFLSNQSLASNQVKPAAAVTAARGASKNPTEADIRVFRNGSVYPSLALILADELSYLPKGSDGLAFGYDVVNSKQFLNTQAWEQAVLFIAKVDKTSPKVDLFGRTTYDADGTPGDVAHQGAATYGKDLIETLKAVYGYEIPEGEAFVDLKIVTDFQFNTPDNIYFIPKPVARGERKGEIELVRRENLTLNVLMPLSMVQAETGAVEAQNVEDDAIPVPIDAEAQKPADVPDAVESTLQATIQEDELEEAEVEFDFSKDN
jgi:hypothetical protein